MFILQHTKDEHNKTFGVSPEVAVVKELLDEQAWLHNQLVPAYRYKTLETLTKEDVERGIPVGSVDFVNRALELLGLDEQTPLLIPEKLNCNALLSRKIGIYAKEYLPELFQEHDKLFLKSAIELKSSYTGIYKKGDPLPSGIGFFVSEVVDFKSEWRCFVYKGKLVALKHYDGNPFLVPDKEIIYHSINRIKDDIDAFTLDVGVIETPTCKNKTAIVEVHNFTSCAFYGFEDQIILRMLEAGWEYAKVHNYKPAINMISNLIGDFFKK